MSREKGEKVEEIRYKEKVIAIRQREGMVWWVKKVLLWTIVRDRGIERRKDKKQNRRRGVKEESRIIIFYFPPLLLLFFPPFFLFGKSLH
jgi:hypothetical protein